MNHILQVKFDHKIRPNQIYDFRGAMIDYVGIEQDLFHNRKIVSGEWGPAISRYPKIQYRCDYGSAVLWAMDEGAEVLKKLLKTKRLKDFEMYGSTHDLNVVEYMEIKGVEAKFTKTKQRYKVRGFLPFNDDKIKEYHELPNLSKRMKLIEQLILNELVLFSYALNWKLSVKQRLKVVLIDVTNVSFGKYKTFSKEKNRMLERTLKSFDLVFEVNAMLPENFSIGRHKAFGYGIVSPWLEEYSSLK